MHKILNLKQSGLDIDCFDIGAYEYIERVLQSDPRVGKEYDQE